MTVGVTRGITWQNTGFSSTHCSCTRWNGSCRGWVGLCAPSPPSPLQNLGLASVPPSKHLLQKHLCWNRVIFGVKPTQARPKDEYKKPHYTIDWKGWLAWCLHAQLVVDVAPCSAVKLNICNLSCLHQQLTVSYIAVKWTRVGWWGIKEMTRCPWNCLCAFKTLK